MARWPFMAVTLAILTSPCIAADEPSKPESPRQFLTRWVSAFSRNSPEAQIAFYDNSDETEVIVSSGFRHRGYKAVLKAYEDDQKVLRYHDSKPKDMSVRRFGDTAIATFEHLFKARMLQDDARWQVHIRTTSVLRRAEGEWRIVHEHSSSIRGIDRLRQLTDE